MSSNGGNVQEAEGRMRQLPGVIAGMEKTLERELGRTPAIAPDAPELKRNTFTAHEPLQTIADALKRLIWDDNEKLAQMITSHFQAEQPASMAAAIQRAADDLRNEYSNSRQ